MTAQAQVGSASTVLVVEDEEPVRTVLQRALQGAGYTVVTCASGDEALEVSAGLSTPIHVLVTDVVMRGLNGRELAAQLKQARPDLRVLFISGYSRQQVGLRDPELDYLEKPFAPSDVVARVREMLAR